MINVKTPRLALHSFEDADRDALVDLFKNETVGRTYMVPELPSREAEEGLFRRLQELSRREDRFVCGIYLGGRLIGFMNDVEINGRTVEMGYALHPDYCGRGYATESFRAAMGQLFASGMEEVAAGAFECNPASLRVMEKCGMSLLDKVTWEEYRGRTYRCVYYSMKREAYGI